MLLVLLLPLLPLLLPLCRGDKPRLAGLVRESLLKGSVEEAAREVFLLQPGWLAVLAAGPGGRLEGQGQLGGRQLERQGQLEAGPGPGALQLPRELL